jgi:hypothetical protein
VRPIADVMDGMFALLGVLIGGLLASLWAYISERRESRMSLYVAAFACLVRWRKVESARRTKLASLDNEVTKLGRDLDKYMIAIPRVLGRRERTRHRRIYERMVTIFSERDLTAAVSGKEAKRIQESIDQLDAEITHEFERPHLGARLLPWKESTAQDVVRAREASMR